MLPFLCHLAKKKTLLPDLGGFLRNKLKFLLNKRQIYTFGKKMLVSLHAICFIIAEHSLWQKEARNITYQVIQAMEVARLEISFYSREMG